MRMRKGVRARNEKEKKRKVSRVVELQRRSTREGRGTGKDELKYRCAS